MSKQNIIVKGQGVPVIMNFEFNGDFSETGLNGFSSISLTIGDETYTTDADPDKLFVESSTQLRLRIGASTNLPPRQYVQEIKGFSAEYPAPVGYLLSGPCLPRFEPIEVREC